MSKFTKRLTAALLFAEFIASMYGIAYVESIVNQRREARAGAIDTPEDGPVAPEGFRWKGHEYRRLAPTPWRLLNAAWESPDRSAPFDGLAETVWQDREYVFDGDPLKAAAKKVRKFFSNNAIPLTLRVSGRLVTICPVSTEDT